MQMFVVLTNLACVLMYLYMAIRERIEKRRYWFFNCVTAGVWCISLLWQMFSLCMEMKR